jgi:ferredoxin
MCRYSEAVEPGTVWTWNAIGKSAGAWNLTPDANESQRGFLLNHLISEELPPSSDGASLSNSDPSPVKPPGMTCGCASTRLKRRARNELSTIQGCANPARNANRPAALASLVCRQGDAEMTQLALVIDLNVCVGCHACVTSCKQWNTSGSAGYADRLQPLWR